MNKLNIQLKRTGAAACAVTLALLAAPAVADVVQPFQFSDAFYIENGIDPTTTTDHFVFPDAKPGFDRTRLGVSPNPDVYNDVRVIETTGGFKHNGNLLYYQAPSFIFETDFLNNAAGVEQREICEAYTAFLFPKAAGLPLSPAPPNRRQDNIFQTNNGYFSNNPLGCWRIRFVAFDGPNVNGSECQDLMADLEDDNGLDLDGTPVITKMGDIEKLEDEGCVQVRARRTTGEDGFPWVA